MRKRDDAHRPKGCIIFFNDCSSALQHIGVTLQLFEANGGGNIGHVALVISTHNIVFPCTKLCFRKRILGLTV